MPIENANCLLSILPIYICFAKFKHHKTRTPSKDSFKYLDKINQRIL